MATRLWQVLTFANVAAGGTATLAHAINVNGTPVIPDFLHPDAAGFALVVADAASITVRNNGSAVASLNLALQYIYSPERLFGQALSHLSPNPFWTSGGAPSSTPFALANIDLNGQNDPFLRGSKNVASIAWDGTEMVLTLINPLPSRDNVAATCTLSSSPFATGPITVVVDTVTNPDPHIVTIQMFDGQLNPCSDPCYLVINTW